MIQYLTNEQFQSNLRLGKSIEQWLGSVENDNYTYLKWLRVDKENDARYSVAYFESFDEGNEDSLDMYEFSTLDPDEPFGVVSTFNSIDEAIDFAEQTYGAVKVKYVPAGIIQEEYNNYLKNKQG